MLKQQISRINQVLTILMVVLFVVSLTAAASNAEPDHDHYHGSHDHHGSHEHWWNRHGGHKHKDGDNGHH